MEKYYLNFCGEGKIPHFNVRLSIILNRNNLLHEKIFISPNMQAVNLIEVNESIFKIFLSDLTRGKTIDDVQNLKFFRKSWSDLDRPIHVKIKVFSFSNKEKEYLLVKDISALEISFLLEQSNIPFTLIKDLEKDSTVIMSDLFSAE